MGHTASRAEVHWESGGHNEGLTDYLNAHDDCTLEIAGPFGNEEAARATETALISALKELLRLRKVCSISPLDRMHCGFAACQFPYNSPIDWICRNWKRRTWRHFSRKRAGLCFSFWSAIRIFVTRSAPSIRRSHPPTRKSSSAFAQWWQLKNEVERVWKNRPQLSPRTLIGLFGTSGTKTIIGAVAIDTDSEGRWEPPLIESPKGGGRVRVPVKMEAQSKLDYRQLRGRRISTMKVWLKNFSPLKQEQFKIFPPLP